MIQKNLGWNEAGSATIDGRYFLLSRRMEHTNRSRRDKIRLYNMRHEADDGAADRTRD